MPPSMRAERTRRACIEEGGITEGMFRLEEHNFSVLDNDFDSNVSRVEISNKGMMWMFGLDCGVIG